MDLDGMQKYEKIEQTTDTIFHFLISPAFSHIHTYRTIFAGITSLCFCHTDPGARRNIYRFGIKENIMVYAVEENNDAIFAFA